MKRNKLITPLLLLSAGVLAGCSSSEVIARPSWIDEYIIDKTDGTDNTMKAIYDAVKRLGDTNSVVLNKILYEIAVNNLGSYSDLQKYANNTHDSWKSLESSTQMEFKEFVNSHKVYQCTDTIGYYKNDNDEVVSKELNEDDKYEVAFQNIKQQFNTLIENIYKQLYNDIKGGSYSTDNVFSEKRFVNHIYTTYMYQEQDAPDADGLKVLLKSGEDLYNKDFVAKDDSNLSDETWEIYVEKFLHVTNGYNEEKYPNVSLPWQSPGYKGYIIQHVIPDVYRTFLIETYVKEQRQNTLGRSSPREINIISMATSGFDNIKLNNLFCEFAKNYITGESESGSPKTEYNFRILDLAINGDVGTGSTNDDEVKQKAYELLEAAGFKQITVKNGQDEKNIEWRLNDDTIVESKHTHITHVFKNTKLGNLVEKYQKVCDFEYEEESSEDPHNGKGVNFKITNKANPDKEIKKELTDSFKHSIEDGIKLKEREITISTNVKHEWYTKTATIDNLDTTMKDRLFDINVSNVLDSDKDPGASDYVSKYSWEGEQSGSAYFLKVKDAKPQSEEWEKIVQTGTNYDKLAIVNVKEAGSRAKLSADSDSSYVKIHAADNEDDAYKSVVEKNELLRKIVECNSTDETYKKNANQYYLMISNILFYDQSVYDYFKSQYPDLFK